MKLFLDPVVMVAGLGLALGLSFDAGACERFVELGRVQVGAGVVMVSIYADEAGFRKTPAASFKLSADQPVLRVPLCDVSGAEIAVTAYQDLNSNGKLDTNLFGLPSEPWGASGSSPTAGPPTWATARTRGDAAVVPVALAR